MYLLVHSAEVLVFTLHQRLKEVCFAKLTRYSVRTTNLSSLLTPPLWLFHSVLVLIIPLVCMSPCMAPIVPFIIVSSFVRMRPFVLVLLLILAFACVQPDQRLVPL